MKVVTLSRIYLFQRISNKFGDILLFKLQILEIYSFSFNELMMSFVFIKDKLSFMLQKLKVFVINEITSKKLPQIYRNFICVLNIIFYPTYWNWYLKYISLDQSLIFTIWTFSFFRIFPKCKEFLKINNFDVVTLLWNLRYICNGYIFVKYFIQMNYRW